jgi:hypothetical protein
MAMTFRDAFSCFASDFSKPVICAHLYRGLSLTK